MLPPVSVATARRGAASELANHSDATIPRRYVHVKVERTRRALEQLPDLTTYGAEGDVLHGGRGLSP